jgi:hypothetical protein
MDDIEKKLKKEKFLEERMANTMKAIPHSEALSAEEKAKYQKALLPLLQSALAPAPQAETLNWGIAAKHSSAPPQAGFDYSASYSLPSKLDFPFAPTPAPPLPQPPSPQDQFLTSLGVSKTPLRIEPFPSPLQKKKKPTPPPPPPAKPIPQGFDFNISYGGRKKILDDPYQNPLNQKLAPWIKAENLMGQNQGTLPNAPWIPQSPSPAQKLEQKLKNVEKLMGEFEEKILEAQNSGDYKTEAQYKKYLSGLESQWMALRGGNFDPAPNPFEGSHGKEVMFLRPLPLPKGDRSQEEEPDKPQEKEEKPFIGPALQVIPRLENKKLILNQDSSVWYDKEGGWLLVTDKLGNEPIVFSSLTNSKNQLEEIENTFLSLPIAREYIIEYTESNITIDPYKNVIVKTYIQNKDLNILAKDIQKVAERREEARKKKKKDERKWEVLEKLHQKVKEGGVIVPLKDLIKIAENIAEELEEFDEKLRELTPIQYNETLIMIATGVGIEEAIEGAKSSFPEEEDSEDDE